MFNRSSFMRNGLMAHMKYGKKTSKPKPKPKAKKMSYKKMSYKKK